MNIVDAFNKLKENPDIVIRCKGLKYKQKLGDIYSKIPDSNIYSKIDIEEPYFSLEEVLSDDWEVLE
jgi:hypothetical protein